MKDSEKIKLLRQIELFHGLTDDEMLEATARIPMKNFVKKETILYREDTNKYMYIILTGGAKVIQSTEEGKEIILAVRRAGEFFGEMSLIDGKTTPAAVVATEPSIVAIISKNDFYSLIHSQKKILNNLLRILCYRLRMSWERINVLNIHNAEQRIKIFFIILARDYGERSEEGVVIKLKLTHQDIADMAGLTRESVSRVILKWQKEGTISSLKKKTIRLNPSFFPDIDIQT
jgi:CRP/FNR family transcriptional regulator